MIEDQKNERETIKKKQTKGILEAEYIEKQSGTTNVRINSRIQEKENRISSVEDVIEEIDSAVKKSVTSQVTEILLRSHVTFESHRFADGKVRLWLGKKRSNQIHLRVVTLCSSLGESTFRNSQALSIQAAFFWGALKNTDFSGRLYQGV